MSVRVLSGVTPTFTRPNDTTTYASGDLVANNTSAASVVPITFAAPTVGRECRIRRAKLTKSAGPVANGSFRYHFFSGAVTVTTNGDNAAFTPTSMALYLGYIDLVMVSPLGGWGWSTDDGAVVWIPATSTDLLNLLIEARAAYVPTAQEVFTPTVELDIP